MEQCIHCCTSDGRRRVSTNQKKKNHEMKHVFFWHVFISFFFASGFVWVCVDVCTQVGRWTRNMRLLLRTWGRGGGSDRAHSGVFFFRCGCAGRRDSVSFSLLLFFCTHVSKHACPDEEKKGDKCCSVPDRGRERIFIHFLSSPLQLTIFLVPSRSGQLGSSWYSCVICCARCARGVDFYQILVWYDMIHTVPTPKVR